MEYGISSVVLRSVFRSKKEGVAVGWKWLEKHELQHWQSSANILTVKKSTRIRWMVYTE